MKRFFCLMLLLTMCMCCLTGCVVKRFEGPNELGYLEEEDMWGYRTYDYDDYQDRHLSVKLMGVTRGG